MYPEGKQILVIDDDTRRRQLIERILIEEGFAVTAVAQGFSAIRAVAGGPFALAIAAVDLPGTLDGAATLRQIRARQPGLKALFTGDVVQWRRPPDPLGDDLFPPPFPPPALPCALFALLPRAILQGQTPCP